MSTHSYIGTVCDDGSILAIYSHFDGYLDGVGRDLVEDYNSAEKALDLINKGDCRVPGEPYNEYDDEKWEDIKPIKYDNLEEFYNGARSQAGHYAYLFMNGEWMLVRTLSDIRPVKNALSRKENS